MDEHTCQPLPAIPFGPFSRASSAASGSSSFSELSVWVLACPLTDSTSFGAATFAFDDVGTEAPVTATSCCFCNAAYKSRKSGDSLIRKTSQWDICTGMHPDCMGFPYQSTLLQDY